MAWVIFTDSSEIRGLLYSATEAGILLTSDNVNNTIDPAKISAIKIRRKGNVSKGAYFGAAGGAVVGFASGIISGDDKEEDWFGFTKEEKGAMGALLLAPIGSGVGALMGTKRISIPINGNTETYRAQLATIQRYCLK